MLLDPFGSVVEKGRVTVGYSRIVIEGYYLVDLLTSLVRDASWLRLVASSLRDILWLGLVTSLLMNAL